IEAQPRSKDSAPTGVVRTSCVAYCPLFGLETVRPAASSLTRITSRSCSLTVQSPKLPLQRGEASGTGPTSALSDTAAAEYDKPRSARSCCRIARKSWLGGAPGPVDVHLVTSW